MSRTGRAQTPDFDQVFGIDFNEPLCMFTLRSEVVTTVDILDGVDPSLSDCNGGMQISVLNYAAQD